MMRCGPNPQDTRTSNSNEVIRCDVLGFLAFAIENPDEGHGDASYLRETEQGPRLMTGRRDPAPSLNARHY